MADVLGALALTQATFQRDLSIALLKSDLDAEAQVADLVAQVAGGGTLSSGPQPLNTEGTGQVVNVIV